jgi:hypothetical protein
VANRRVSAPFTTSDHKNRTAARCSSLVQTSGGTAIFTPRSLDTNGLQLNHTRSMSPSDLEPQYGQASAVLPTTQRKYPHIADAFLIILISCDLLSEGKLFVCLSTTQWRHITYVEVKLLAVCISAVWYVIASFTLRPFYRSGNSLWNLLDRMLGEAGLDFKPKRGMPSLSGNLAQ